VTLLHVFDMDGTLLSGTSASMLVSRHLGCVPQLLALEEEFATGTMPTHAFSLVAAELFQGVTDEVADEVFAAAPWIRNINKVTADIRQRGEHSLAITMSPDFFAKRLCGFGVDEVVASTFPPLPLSGLPDPKDILTPGDKVTITERTLTRLGLERDQCVAYGDSLSDAPLFKELRHTVAVNADAHLEGLAKLTYEGDDLWEAYTAARRGMEA
jgi:phosphoserine phosphatase